jgi:hypothetical protein
VAERLAVAFDASALRRRDDLLRVGAWQLEAGVATLPALLLEAARQAAARFDHELTERLDDCFRIGSRVSSGDK